MDELRFCALGCCRFINDRTVSNAEYESVPRPVIGPPIVEALISCRRSLNDVQKNTENTVGFYLGGPLKQVFGTLITTGGKALVFEASTDKRLREATEEDVRRWNDAWKQAVKAELEKNKNQPLN